MSTEVASISLGLNLDTGQLSRSINDCVNRASTRMVSGFNGISNSIQSSVQRINASIESSTNRLSRQETAIEAQRNAVSRLNTTLGQARSLYNEQTAAINQQEEVVSRLQAQYEQLSGRIGPPTREGTRELTRLCRELESARNRLRNLNQSATITSNRMTGISDNITTANSRLSNMQAEADQTRRHIEDLNGELSNMQQSVSPVQDSMSEITSLIKSVGVAIIAAFSIKKIVDFGASCIELGSDLAEVQNVVDVTFSNLSKQVDSFAKEAAVSFGLSETMAKKFTGTFGAMSKAFGFGEQAAYEMSTTLTGLSGDVASFYNISQDEAYTKLKSVFTGETESLNIRAVA